MSDMTLDEALAYLRTVQPRDHLVPVMAQLLGCRDDVPEEWLADDVWEFYNPLAFSSPLIKLARALKALSAQFGAAWVVDLFHTHVLPTDLGEHTLCFVITGGISLDLALEQLQQQPKPHLVLGPNQRIVSELYPGGWPRSRLFAQGLAALCA